GSAFARKGALAKAAKGMRMARNALCQLNDSERERLDLALGVLGLDKEFGIDADTYEDPFAKDSVACEQIAGTFADVLNWATGVERAPLTIKDRGRGRPKGSKAYAQLEALVHTLMQTAELCGGKLTFARHPQRGTLLKAIEMMRQLSPPGFIPKVLPLAAIERARNDYRRNQRRSDEIMRKYRGKDHEEVEF